MCYSAKMFVFISSVFLPCYYLCHFPLLTISLRNVSCIFTVTCDNAICYETNMKILSNNNNKRKTILQQNVARMTPSFIYIDSLHQIRLLLNMSVLSLKFRLFCYFGIYIIASCFSHIIFCYLDVWFTRSDHWKWKTANTTFYLQLCNCLWPPPTSHSDTWERKKIMYKR